MWSVVFPGVVIMIGLFGFVACLGFGGFRIAGVLWWGGIGCLHGLVVS